jgi:PAS domain S-box-containing protein
MSPGSCCWSWTTRGRIALINRKGCEVLGWPESQLLGADWFGRFLPPPLQEQRRELFNRLLTGDGALPARDETTIINASGEQRLIDWRNILLRSEGGHIQGVLSSGEDITERKQIERQLHAQQSQLEVLVARRTADLTAALAAAKVADRAKDAFLANVSHELRTPLNAVIGLSELARRLGTDPRQRDYLDKIANAGKTLCNLINDLLDLSKIAAGRLSFASVTFSLRDLVRRSNSVISHKATEKGLELCERIDDEVPDVLVGDPLRVEQILLNLLSNAIKFTAAGRVAIGIGVGQREAQRVCLDIVVEDTGVGISEEGPQPAVRAILAGRRDDVAALWRQRPRPGHLPPPGDADGWRDQRQQPPRGRQHLPRHDLAAARQRRQT